MEGYQRACHRCHGCLQGHLPRTEHGLHTEQQFISKIVLACQKHVWKHHIHASTIVAQAILVSGWGKNPFCNDLFCAKSRSVSEPRCLSNTGEHSDGKYTRINAYFRAYNSWEDSIADHSTVLLKSRHADRPHSAALRRR